MIRIVLDTNVVVSALLQPLGPPVQAIEFCMTGQVYAEYDEVIRRPRFRFGENVIADALRAIREKGVWVKRTQTIRACVDPDDDIFLECAQAGRAAYLVTGNLKHFPARWPDIWIAAGPNNSGADRREGNPANP